MELVYLKCPVWGIIDKIFSEPNSFCFQGVSSSPVAGFECRVVFVCVCWKVCENVCVCAWACLSHSTTLPSSSSAHFLPCSMSGWAVGQRGIV